MRRVQIFDTTLRDGEQSPGISLSVEEKVEIAHQLARLKVDVIEAGFPITSEGDFESVSRIATEVKGPTIAGLARIHQADIERAWEAVQWSSSPRIHTFVGTSDLHIEHQMRSNQQDIPRRAGGAAAPGTAPGGVARRLGRASARVTRSHAGEVGRGAGGAVRLPKSLCRDVEVSPMDATRTE